MLKEVHKNQVSQVINTTWYYFLTCTDAKWDVWKDSIITEPNEDDISAEGRDVGQRLTTTGGGMYKLVHCNCFFFHYLVFVFIM